MIIGWTARHWVTYLSVYCLFKMSETQPWKVELSENWIGTYVELGSLGQIRDIIPHLPRVAQESHEKHLLV
jgi:hypothetical protein